MKTIQYLFTAILLLGVISACKKEYEPAGPEANKIYVVVPSSFTQIHEPLTFGDLSSGVSKRLWTFPTSADIIDEDGNTSSESIVQATFTEPGFYQVNLHVEFPDELIDNGIHSGTRVVDSIIIVEILDSVRAEFTANYRKYEGGDSTSMTVAAGAANPLWAGEYVRFTSTMYGRPSDFGWYFEGGNPEYYEGTDSSIVVQYRRLGRYGVAHLCYRTNPASIDTVYLDDLIEVIPTGRRASVVSTSKLDSRTVEVEFSLGMQEPVDIESNFSFTVINDEDGQIAGIEVADIAFDTENPYYLTLTLNDDIYDDDSVYISYTQGTLTDEFSNLVPEFTNKRVVSVLEDLLPEELDAGFETNPTLWTQQDWGNEWNPSNSIVEVSTAQFHSGTSALRVQVNAGSGAAIQAPASYAINEGDVIKMSFWMNITNKGDLGLSATEQSNAGLYNGDWVNAFSNYLQPTETALDGWQYYTWIFYPTPEDPGALFPLIRGYCPNSSSPIEFYVDDLTIERFEERTRP